MVTIRPRTNADFAGLEEALHTCHAVTGWPLEGLPDAKAFITGDQGPLEQAWVAVCEDEIIGHIAVNKPIDECPAVAAWRQQNGKEERIAVVGRLFVAPAKRGEARGVTTALIQAVSKWGREHDVRLINYVVVWSAARELMAHVLAARYEWVRYAHTEYHSPMDGRVIPAICYAAPRDWTMIDAPSRSTQDGASWTRLIMGFNSNFWSIWRNPKAYFKITYLLCHIRLSRILFPVVGGR